MNDSVMIQNIEGRILIIRGQRVMIDSDLVKRNINRFPEDFMFLLSEQEKDEVVAICDHLAELKFSHQPPIAFTEQGVAMLSSVLNGKPNRKT